ncbi:hypothetical protein M758_12G064000, partial [Ceratodon purpureus]
MDSSETLCIRMHANAQQLAEARRPPGPSEGRRTPLPLLHHVTTFNPTPPRKLLSLSTFASFLQFSKFYNSTNFPTLSLFFFLLLAPVFKTPCSSPLASSSDVTNSPPPKPPCDRLRPHPPPSKQITQKILQKSFKNPPKILRKSP